MTDDQAIPELHADPAPVDAVLTASRSMVAVATRSLGAVTEETTIAQYRALVVLASRGPQRITGLAEALDVAQALRAFAGAAGEVPDSDWPAAVPAAEGSAPRRPGFVQPGGPELPVPSARDRAKEGA